MSDFASSTFYFCALNLTVTALSSHVYPYIYKHDKQFYNKYSRDHCAVVMNLKQHYIPKQPSCNIVFCISDEATNDANKNTS